MVKIHREAAKTDFLGIKNENWQAASRDLGAHGLRLYLYLAANADNYELALSPAAIRSAIGMPRSTYHDQFHILEDKGYIKRLHGNTFEFYEKPRRDIQAINEQFSDGLPNPQTVKAMPTADNITPSANTEINNKYTDNKINIDSLQQQEALQANETVIHIKPPKATGKNRPEYKPKEKPFFNF